jgi:hypothetical protein
MIADRRKTSTFRLLVQVTGTTNQDLQTLSVQFFQQTTVVSYTPPWLASGFGCQGRRPSTV